MALTQRRANHSSPLALARRWVGAATALCLLAAAPLGAVDPEPALVKDIAPGTPGSAPGQRMVNAAGTLYFFADDGINGRQLWKSDGTFEGTVMVTDPATQGPFALPFLFAAAGARVYWKSTSDGVSEVWTSDGTSGGTQVVLNVESPDTFNEMHGVGSTLYVTSSDGGLWRCTGTTATLVRQFDQTPWGLTSVGATLYFSGHTAAAGSELWATSGGGASMVKDIYAGSGSSNPGGLTVFDGKVYFAATTAAEGRELWASDGSEGGTALVKDVQRGGGHGMGWLELPVLVVAGPTLYFLANDGTTGRELWGTDGTEDGTRLVQDISPYEDGYSSLTAVGNTLFFVVTFEDTPITVRFELWKSTGTAGGTGLVYQPLGGGVSSPKAALNGRLLFANNPVSPVEGGMEPWTSDGSSSGTTRLADLHPGPNGSFPQTFVPVGSLAYFQADDGARGYELWRTDGTAAGTTLVRDINEQGLSSDIRHLRAMDGTLYFSARNATVGRELWKSDGSSAGTTVVKDIALNSLNADPVPLGTLGGQLIFRAWDHLTGGELWKTNGTTAGTVQVKDLRAGTATAMPDTVQGAVARDRVFFAADDGVAGTELWKTDGTAGGTVLVKDLAPGAAASNPTHLTTFGDRVFFVANDGASGTEVWVSDGTGPGTVRLKDVAPGAASGAEGPLVAVGTTLFFRGNDGATGFELWKTDGTGAGTERVRDIRAGAAGSEPRELTASGGRLFFTATDGSTGTELWRSDGTAGGTALVRDLSPGAADTTFTHLADLNGRLLFTGWPDGGDVELWRSDGTSAGTVLVKDILPGPDSSVPLHTTVVHGRAYFAADDGDTGFELWRSDGTTAGTVRVADIRSGEDSSYPKTFFAVGTTLYFAATGRASEGEELWKLNVTPSPPTLDVPTGTIAVGVSNTVTGTNFTAGSVIKLFVATAGGAVAYGPYTPSAVTTTSLTWTIPASVPLGTGFVALQVINTDTGYLASNVVGALLIGGEVALVPSILTINGVGLAPPDLSIPVAHIDTVVAQGSTVTIDGTAFLDPVVNLFTAAGNVGPLFPLAGATPNRIQVVIPAAAPTGPGNFQVVNRPSYFASNAVASTLGAVPAITSVTAAGGVITVRGAGFSTLSVINVFNRQGGTAVNLGGLDGSTPRLPLTVVNDTEFSFVRPAGAVAGPSFVEVLNPPFIPFASSGTDPDGAFTMPLPPPLYTRMEGAAPSAPDEPDESGMEGAAPSAPDESRMEGAAPSAPVTWTHAVNAVRDGGALTSTGGRAWHAGARSTAALVTGDGAVTWRVRREAGDVAFGLTHDDAAPTLADIDFAFRLDAATRELAIVEDGVTRHRAGPYAAGDRLRIAVRAGQVEYARNGHLLWTSATAPRYPLVADASLGAPGASLRGVRLHGARLGATVAWGRDEAVALSSSRVTARRPATVASAGPVVPARSTGGAGGVVEATLTGAAGLGLGAPDGSCTYCLVREGGAVRVVHAGTVRGTVPAPAAATVRVEVTPDGRVRYWVAETLVDEARRAEDGVLGVRGVLRAPGATIAHAIALSP